MDGESEGGRGPDGLAAEVARVVRAAREARQRLDEVAVTVDGPRHLFSVTVDGRGLVEDFDLPDDRYRSLPPAELATMIGDVLRQAQQEALEQARLAVGAVLPIPAFDPDAGMEDLLASMAGRLQDRGLASPALDELRRRAGEAW